MQKPHGIGCLRVHRYFGHSDMCLTDFKIELEIDEKNKKNSIQNEMNK